MNTVNNDFNIMATLFPKILWEYFLYAKKDFIVAKRARGHRVFGGRYILKTFIPLICLLNFSMHIYSIFGFSSAQCILLFHV